MRFFRGRRSGRRLKALIRIARVIFMLELVGSSTGMLNLRFEVLLLRG